MKTKKLEAVGYKIELQSQQSGDFISLTDIAKYKTKENPGYVIQNWMRNRNTVRFLGLWESLHNTQFNYLEFEAIEKESGLNSFVLTPKRWIEMTAAIGITTKQGRYASTFAHKDIAFEFASWISPEFKLYIIQEYQHLRERENITQSLDWNLKRELSKINYKIHTDAIKMHLIPPALSKKQQGITYASEADNINVALFGMTAKEWRESNSSKEGNIRDYVNTIELAILSNLEFYNSKLIEENIPQQTRLILLNNEANKEKELFNKNNEKVLKITNNE